MLNTIKIQKASKQKTWENVLSRKNQQESYMEDGRVKMIVNAADSP